MHHADKTVTIFNALLDEETGYDIYKRTVLAGVSWFSRVKTNVDGDGGLTAANEFTVRIPGAQRIGYVPPETYAGADGTWTLQAGDIIVKGMATETDPRPADLKKSYGDIMTIIGVTDNRGGRGGHIKVVGK